MTQESILKRRRSEKYAAKHSNEKPNIDYESNLADLKDI